ncbi:rhomboid-like protein [Amycolatopsis anabasis]|uniref:rhomboid-like protein n=1 Tax=Amycolatopsis anabasis TaxID=1840409 RepID=UPI0015D16BBC|nr:rhomboid-like protein [Amycolatopsis anabasis]
MQQDVVEHSAPARWPARVAAALPRPSTTPFTFWYLAVLLVTSIVLHVLPQRTADRLLELSSTDVHNLWHRPILTLITSALWLTDARWAVYAVLFALMIAPLERRIGPWWTAAIFLSGHVLATLATELPVMAAVSAHVLSPADARWLDVGVSYGLFAAAGALTPILPAQIRGWTIAALESGILLIYLADGPDSIPALVTFAGHVIALHLGMLGWLPWLRRRGLVGSFRPLGALR